MDPRFAEAHHQQEFHQAYDGQRAAADLIDTRHAVKTACAQLALHGGLTTDFATRRFGPHGNLRRYSRSRRRAALPLRSRR